MCAHLRGMTEVAYIDLGVGESRAALYQDDRPVEVWVERWSDAGRRALYGERYLGLIRKQDKRSGLTFVDIGVGDPAILSGGSRAYRAVQSEPEGAPVVLSIVREAEGDKGPRGSISVFGEDAARALRNDKRKAPFLVEGPKSLRRHGADALADRPGWRGAEIELGLSASLEVDAAIELALQTEWPIPMGGRITIEPTRACVAIDVDSGARLIGGRPEARYELNQAAARSALTALRLKALGGLAMIDFVSMRRANLREALRKDMRALGRKDPAEIVIGAIDAFDVCILQRTKTYASLASRLLEADGSPTAETLALDGLRALQREGAAQRGRRLVLSLPSAAHSWLLANEKLDWRAVLAERIGARFDIEADNNPKAVPHARVA